MQAIKRNCSPLAHLPPASNIRVRYRDEDGDTINLWENSSGFSFGEMLRSAKEVKERDFKKIFLQATELDSTLFPVKWDGPTWEYRVRKLTTSRCNLSNYLSRQKPRVPQQQQATTLKKSSLDFQRQEIEGNVQILKVQVASAKEELEKLNWESRHFQSRDVFCSLYRSITLCTNPGLERTSCAIWRRSNSS